ncbi:MAG TPA: GGDEF domain-containing protein [Noviherbaspirillum sp.]
MEPVQSGNLASVGSVPKPLTMAGASLTRVRVILLGLLGVTLVGALDVAVGYQISMLILHAIPVLFVTWFASFRWGVFFVALMAVISAMVILFVAPPGVLSLYRFLDLGSDSIAMLLLVFMQSRLRSIYDHALHHSRTDALTGCWNKRGFGEELQNEIDRHKRYDHPFALIYFDCDNFKAVNDTHGHHVGDALLAEIGRVLRAELRAVDVVGRLGGDEFGVLLRESEPEAAARAVEFMKRALDTSMRANQWPVSFSIGIVSFARAPASAETALAAADALMYEVKKQGRNGIRMERH